MRKLLFFALMLVVVPAVLAGAPPESEPFLGITKTLAVPSPVEISPEVPRVLATIGRPAPVIVVPTKPVTPEPVEPVEEDPLDQLDPRWRVEPTDPMPENLTKTAIDLGEEKICYYSSDKCLDKFDKRIAPLIKQAVQVLWLSYDKLNQGREAKGRRPIPRKVRIKLVLSHIQQLANESRFQSRPVCAAPDECIEECMPDNNCATRKECRVVHKCMKTCSKEHGVNSAQLRRCNDSGNSAGFVQLQVGGANVNAWAKANDWGDKTREPIYYDLDQALEVMAWNVARVHDRCHREPACTKNKLVGWAHINKSGIISQGGVCPYAKLGWERWQVGFARATRGPIVRTNGGIGQVCEASKYTLNLKQYARYAENAK